MRTAWQLTWMLFKSPGPSYSIFKPGIIKFGSMDSLASLGAKNPTLRQRHLRTRSKQTLLCSESCIGINSIHKWDVFLIFN